MLCNNNKTDRYGKHTAGESNSCAEKQNCNTRLSNFDVTRGIGAFMKNLHALKTQKHKNNSNITWTDMTSRKSTKAAWSNSMQDKYINTQMHKYTNTQIQIHHQAKYNSCAEEQHARPLSLTSLGIDVLSPPLNIVNGKQTHHEYYHYQSYWLRKEKGSTLI